MTAITPILTTVGLNALINAQNDGLEARISHVAFGNGVAPAGQSNATPLATQLGRERIRVPISGGQKVGSASVAIEAVLDQGVAFDIYEIGFYLDDGTLLAIWSSATPLVGYTPGFSLAFGYTLVLSGVPADVVNVTVVAPALNFTITSPFISLATEIVRLQRRALETEKERLVPTLENVWS